MWKSRYCVLEDRVLRWYRNEENAKKNHRCRGEIELAGATVAERGEYSFAILPRVRKKIYLFECKLLSDYKAWLRGLRLSCADVASTISPVLPNSPLQLSPRHSTPRRTLKLSACSPYEDKLFDMSARQYRRSSLSDSTSNAKAAKVARGRALAQAAHKHTDIAELRDNAHADLVSVGEVGVHTALTLTGYRRMGTDIKRTNHAFHRVFVLYKCISPPISIHAVCGVRCVA